MVLLRLRSLFALDGPGFTLPFTTTSTDWESLFSNLVVVAPDDSIQTGVTEIDLELQAIGNGQTSDIVSVKVDYFDND